MCGIIGIIDEFALKKTMEGLKLLEYRGYDSTGIAATADSEAKHFIIKKGVGGPSEIFSSEGFESLKNLGSYIAIGHTRWATHGGVSEENAHPFLQGSVLLVHNGVTSNYLNLKDELKDYSFQSDTDSEVIAALLDKNIKEFGIEAGIEKALGKIRGDYALLFLIKGEEKIFFAVKGQPLLLSKNKALSSDASAFTLLGEGTYCAIKDGSYGYIDGNKAHLYRGGLGKEEKIPSQEAVGRGSFAHFMRKEIEEQKYFYKRAMAVDLTDVRNAINEAKAVFFVAAGTSYNAAKFLQHHMYKENFKRNVWKPLILKYGHEFYPGDWANLEKSVFITLSQSGETLDIIKPLKEVKGKVKIISVVNRLASTLAELSDIVVPIGVEVEVGVAATKSYLNQLILAYRIAGIDLDEAALEESILEGLGKEAEAINTAQSLPSQKHIFVLGKGELKYIASEIKLKMQELTYLSLESLASGELKHGPLATIESGSKVIALIPRGEKGKDSLGEVVKALARGADVIALTPIELEDEAKNIMKKYPKNLRIVLFSSKYLPISYAVFGQLLAYHTALKLGRNPDKPRNLAKSVTVR